jgi:hypothetical protein
MNSVDTQEQYRISQTIYKWTSLCLSIIFALVGLIFLFFPDTVILFFNTISKPFGFAESPTPGFSIYHVLAVGYMYLVALLAYFMYKYPENSFFPVLLINGKSASSLLSFMFFFLHLPSLLFLANGIIDGTIAIGVFVLYRKSRGSQQ